MASRRHNQNSQQEERANLLDEVLHDHRGALLRSALHNSRLDQDAEDAVGDACVQFLIHFRGETAEEARRWLLVVVKRCAWGITRRRQERDAVLEEFSIDALRVGGAASLGEEGRDPAWLAETVGELVPAPTGLKPDESRGLLLLAAGYRLSEIASIQGWTYTKVKRCVYEGRRRLRTLRRQEGEDR